MKLLRLSHIPIGVSVIFLSIIIALTLYFGGKIPSHYYVNKANITFETDSFPPGLTNVDLLLQVAEDSLETNPQKSLKYTELAIDISLNNKNRFNEAKSRYWRSRALIKNPSSARSALTESLKSYQLLKEVENHYWSILCLKQLGTNYFYLGDVDSANTYISFATSRVKNIIGHPRDSLKALAEIVKSSAWFRELDGDLDSAIYFQEKSIELYTFLKDQTAIADGKMYLGTLYGDKGYELNDSIFILKADQEFSQAVEIFQKFDKTTQLAQTYYFRGRWFNQLFNLTLNSAYFRSSLENYKTGLQFDKKLSCDTYCGIGTMFIKFKKEKDFNAFSSEDSALFYYETALAEAEKELNEPCFNNIVDQLSYYCNEEIDCSIFFSKIANIQRLLHSKDIKILEKEHQKLEKFKLDENERLAYIERTKLVWLGSSTFFFLCILFIYFYQKQRIKNLKSEIAMKLAALRAQMNPHFISNSLNAIEELIHDNQPQRAANYLIDFSRFSRTILDSSIEGSISLKKEVESLHQMLELEKLRLPDKLEYIIEIPQKLLNSKIHIPSMILQPYIENAIWHGISPKPTGGTVKISIQKHKERQIQCIIEDNGIGRIESQRRKELGVVKRKSHGMKITEERIKAIQNLKGTKPLIEDLYDETGKPIGTRVTLLLPI